jgi:hypothetical protein
MASPRDFIQYIFDIFSGQPTPTKVFNPDRIVTCDLNSAGHQRLIYDSVSGTYIASGPDVVVDNAGNVVTTN